MNSFLQKNIFSTVCLLFSITLLAQQSTVQLTSSSSPLVISSTVQSNVTAMSNPNSGNLFTLSIYPNPNQSLSGQSSVIQLAFSGTNIDATMYQVSFTSLPSYITFDNTNNTLIITNSDFLTAGWSSTNPLVLTYSVQFCYLSQFSNQANSSGVFVSLAFTAPDNNTVMNGSSQNVNVIPGQSVLYQSSTNTNVNANVGNTFLRSFLLTANSQTPFTGVIQHTDVLGSALQLTGLSVSFPTASNLNPLSYSLNFTATGVTAPGTGTISAVLDFANNSILNQLYPSGIPITNQILITENITVINCPSATTGNNTGLSRVFINWYNQDWIINQGCLPSAGPITQPNVSLLIESLTTQIQYYYSPPTSEGVCYRINSTDPIDAQDGINTFSQVYTNTSDLSFTNIRFQIGGGNTANVKIPLEGINLTRTNPLNPNRNLSVVDFSKLISSSAGSITSTANLQPIISGYSSYSTITTANNNAIYLPSPDLISAEQAVNLSNIVAVAPFSMDCSYSNFQVGILFLDRSSVTINGTTTIASLDYIPGDVYTLTWQEIECCRTDQFVANNTGVQNNLWFHFTPIMAYPTCLTDAQSNYSTGFASFSNIYTSTNPAPTNTANTIPEGYLLPYRSMNLTLETLPSTTYIYAGPLTPGASNGEQGVINMLLNVNTNGLFYYDNNLLTDDGDPIFLDIDIQFSDGLKLLDANANAGNIFMAVNGSEVVPASIIINPLLDPITQAPLTLISPDPSISTSSLNVTSYYTLRFNTNDIATALGLSLAAGNANISGMLINLQAEAAKITIPTVAYDCPPGNFSYISLRSYILDKPSCNSCRNLLSSTGFVAQIHCPGCHIPGPNVSLTTALRDVTSMGPQDNNNDGVPDQNPTTDLRDYNNNVV